MLEELITTARRVYCLYRVSTLGQVEKDDIPMQKEACREFVRQHPGWEIVREFSEKGVSGFKVSAKDRQQTRCDSGDPRISRKEEVRRAAGVHV